LNGTKIQNKKTHLVSKFQALSARLQLQDTKMTMQMLLMTRMMMVAMATPNAQPDSEELEEAKISIVGQRF
jgi:hypothetical protein